MHMWPKRAIMRFLSQQPHNDCCIVALLHKKRYTHKNVYRFSINTTIEYVRDIFSKINSEKFSSNDLRVNYTRE